MKMLLGLLVLTVTLSGFVLADPPASDEAAADPLLQFRRDQRLVSALVEGGLDLASESEALKRAGTCNRLAEQVSRAIEDAAKDNERARATALVSHLQTMLVRGVAFNAKRAKSTLPAGPARQKALEGILADTDRFTTSVEYRLKHMADSLRDTGEATLRPVQLGRLEVRRAIQGDGPFVIPPGKKD